VITTRHDVHWRTPSPAWPSTPAADTAALLRPAVLRFSSDTFMDDLARLLDTRPRDLPAQVAKPVTFRVADAAPGDPPPTLDHLKLYQPAHGDFYLVAASLVCAVPGLPDRTVDAAAGDRVAFVLRRMVEGTELAWVDDPASATGRSWLPLPAEARTAVAAGEDLLPMFPVNFADDGEERRLLVGYIPTASKESYVASATIEPRPVQPADPRLADLEARVIVPLTALRARATLGAEPERVDSSRFLLLDLGRLLAEGAPAVWQAILGGVQPGPGPARLLYDALGAVAQPGTPTTWRSALAQAWAQRRDISGESGTAPSLAIDLAGTTLDPGSLRALVRDVLPAGTTGTGPAVAPLPVPKLDPRGAARYVVRCVYLRPHCGPLQPDILSAPTEEFAIASFFDFDAPARDIQITLPADTSMKDLRKFQRNVRLIISDQLRQQLSRLSPLKELGEGTLAPGESVSLGWICSFSMPIITICALVVLFTFLSLLNIIFWWLPFVKVCLPVPLKGK
jgi:hypothetical protein